MLLAPFVEYHEKDSQFSKRLTIAGDPLLSKLGLILMSHLEEVPAEKIQAALDENAFNPEQQSFIWRWVRREIRLVF